MKKEDTDIQDIYLAEESPLEAPSVTKISEQLQREAQKQLIFNLSAGLLSALIFSALIMALISDYWLEPDPAVSTRTKPLYVASYTLPDDEKWATEYFQIAFQADTSEPAGPKEFSSKWVKNAAYHLIMGEQALRQDDPAAAEPHFTTAIETFPTLIGARRYLGTIYLKKQLFGKAIEQLEKALEEERSVSVLNNLGTAYMGVENYASAEALLKEALLQEPDCAGCYKNLALLYQKTGRTNDAFTAFESYLSLNPQDTHLLETYVDYLEGAGRVRDAISFLDRIKGEDPLAGHLLLAKLSAQDGDAERAACELRNAARAMTPRQTIEKMHDPVFDKISRTEPFETLLYQLELAIVSLSTNLTETGIR